MIGSIVGDVVGSKFESSPKHPKQPVQTKNFGLFYKQSRFTDDTVLTCATAETLLNSQNSPCNLDMAKEFAFNYRLWGKKYPDRGYGSGFKKWLEGPFEIMNSSYGNGAMMRCSPIGLYYNDLASAVNMANHSVIYTHHSPESIRGVQSIVSAIWMARHGKTKQQIKEHVEEYYGHMLDKTVEELKNMPKTTIRCNVTAPQALQCFMESTDYESAIRNAVYIGGDTDTNAAIAGSIAEAFYGINSIPKSLIRKTKMRLDPEIINLVDKFYASI